MSIREATKEDAGDVACIHVKAWQKAYFDIMPESYLDYLSIDEKTEVWSKALTEKGLGITLVIEEDELIVGFCVFGPVRDDDLSHKNSGELVALNILPSHWNKGLGSMLINAVLEYAQAKKWDALYLWVLKQNNKAIAVYKYHGFELEGLEKMDSKLTGHALDEIRFVKKLLDK